MFQIPLVAESSRSQDCLNVAYAPRVHNAILVSVIAHVLLVSSVVGGSVLVSGCFAPSLPEPLQCSVAVGCPGGLVCINDVCEESGGGAEPGAFDFVDDRAEDFVLGTMSGTKASGDALLLEEGVADGTFISRVFDAQSTAAAWKMFEFIPMAPYGIGLRDEGGLEDGYASGNIDMTDNILLLHCDGSIDDTSSVKHVVKVGGVGGTPQFLDGVIGQSCRVDSPFDLSVPVGTGGPLNFGTSDYTWVAWVRTIASCAGNQVVIGADAQQAPGGAHVWMGCAQGSNQNCADLEGGFFSGVHSSVHGTDGLAFCGSTVINDGNWHHIALVKRGHGKVMVAAYVDGVLEDVAEDSFEQPISFPEGNVFGIGRYPDDGFDPDDSTEVDELALWRRALTAAEIRAIYERGAFGVSLRVAVCTSPNCEGPFTNEVNDSQSDIKDVGLGTIPPAFELDIPLGRYFRYRVRMTNPLAVSGSPQIRRISVSGIR